MALFRSSALQTSSSSSSFSSSRCCYDVFLSFRGEDTRKTFTDHLYTALVNANFRTFRDNDDLERGEDIKPEFRKAIQQSRSSIIVFSKDYASSGWCLNELVMILKQKKTSGHVVLPVFYDVDPSHLRKQTGSVAEAFTRHQKTQPCETFKDWREALSEAADLAGMVLQNEEDGHEARFIMKVVRVIEDKLRRMHTRSVIDRNRNLVGMHSRVKDINLWLRDGPGDVGILVLHGMRGIGKTTIARDVYKSNLGRFERHSFVENIREISGQSNGLIQIQKQLLGDISGGRKVKIHNVHEGIARIEDVVSSKKVLLVLDDVDCTDQLDGVLLMQDRFYPGSKIIITTNNVGLLNSYHEAVNLHMVQTLCEDESLELLSLYAFGQHHPPEAYMNHSERMVQHCEGLPLALKILGSSLSGKSIAIWESALKKLEVIPNDQILKKLKISFDALQDGHDQDLFLHIACFFIGMEKDVVVTILDACDFQPDIGIENLVDRHLVIISYNNRLQMHHMIRDMGRAIIRLESKEPGERSRLWHPKDSFNVLTEKTGTKAIGGLVLDMQVHPAYARSKNSNDQVVLEIDAFSRMNKLRLLQLSYVQLKGSYNNFPRGLRWLCWNRFPYVHFPIDFSLERLVVLEMCYSSLRQLWEGTERLTSLKILNLSHSHHLIAMSNFSVIPNLERLTLKDCVNLVDVHESIGSLKGLVYLNMEDCKSMRKLPENISRLTTLETLNISGCSNLNEFPSREMGKKKYQKLFHASGARIHPLLITTEEVKLLPRQISWISHLPSSLVDLRLESCNLSDDDFPTDCALLNLKRLDLSKNPICNLPAFIRKLQLSYLSVSECMNLKSITRLPIVGKLRMYDCKSLERVTFLSFRNFAETDVHFRSPYKLAELEYRYKLEPIERVDVEMIDLLGLSNCKFSTETRMVGCEDKMRNMPVRRGPMQGLYEFGIFSTFVHGNEVPGLFSNRSIKSSISFTVPLLPDHLRIRGLNYFSIYATSRNSFKHTGVHPLIVEVRNNTKDLKWCYFPLVAYVPEKGQDMIWLSHWKFGNKVEPGDELTFATDSGYMLQIKECGIQVVYEQEEKMKSTVDSTTDMFYPNVIAGDLSHHQYNRRYVLSNGYYRDEGIPSREARKRLEDCLDV